MLSLFQRRTSGRDVVSVVRPEAAVAQPDPAVAQPDAALARLLTRTRFELVPIKSVNAAIDELAPGASASVTCSPVKGLGATLDVTARLLEAAHDAVPHLAARLVEDRRHVARLAAWIHDHGLREVFIVGGDEATAAGPYADGTAFLRELLEHDTGLARVGVPAYPDGHPTIPDSVLRAALHDKQALIAAAGLEGSATTQMCFDPGRITGWLRAERDAGLVMPIDLGIPGVVDRAKLMSMGVRLGIGSSLRFLRKQRTTMTAMLAPGGYDPTDLIVAVAAEAQALRIHGVHSFTFNSVAKTEAWRRALLRGVEE